MNFELLLRERNLKVTPQRLGILTLLHDDGHASVDDLYQKIQKQFSSISLATLYKNINAMIETSLLKEIKVPNMKSKYEIVKHPHAHLVCHSCGTLEDIEIDISGLNTFLASQSNFEVHDTDLTFSGICHSCQQ